MDRLIMQEGSIFEKGYGILAKKVMQDTREIKYKWKGEIRKEQFTPEAKAIYSYLITYAGNGNQAYPGAKKMANELGMGKNRFYKHLKILLNSRYIKKEKRRNEKGNFKGNNYIIVHFLKEKRENSKNPDTTGNRPCRDFPDTDNPYMESNDTNSNNINNKTEEEDARAKENYPQQKKEKIPKKVNQKFKQVFNRKLSVEFYKKLKKIYSDDKIILKALSVAELNADKPKYILTILKDWKENNITSISEIEQYLKNRQAQKEINKSKNQTSGTDNTNEKSLEELYDSGYR